MLYSRQHGGAVAVLQGSVRKVPTSYNAKKTTSDVHYWFVSMCVLLVCSCGPCVVRLVVFLPFVNKVLKVSGSFFLSSASVVSLFSPHMRAHTHTCTHTHIHILSLSVSTKQDQIKVLCFSVCRWDIQDCSGSFPAECLTERSATTVCGAEAIVQRPRKSEDHWRVGAGLCLLSQGHWVLQ